MKLNMGDRVKYNGSIYTVAAVLFSTVYLRAVNDDTADYNYKIEDVYKKYKDVEILG